MVEPSSPSRTLAAGVHFASIPFPLAGPLVGLVVGVVSRDRFVREHAVRALFAEILGMLIVAVVVITSLSLSIAKLEPVLRGDWSKIDVWGLILKSVLVWLSLAAFGLWNTVSSVRRGLRALQGESRS